MSLRFRDLDDFDNDDSTNGLLFGLFILSVFACLMSVSIVFWRRRRRLAQQAAILPTHQPRGHHRSLTITTTPTYVGQDKVFVYDEKMNLIANSHGPRDSAVPEIRITFPDEVDPQGEKLAGRVVVVRITDSGSVGMEPLQQEQLPPYQQADSERYQSLDLNLMGGLREGPSPSSQPRWA